jgi:hypothetical protein
MLFCLGDADILEIIFKHFPFAPLNGISKLNESDNYLIRDKPHCIELKKFQNYIPLLYVIRDDHPDLLLVLLKFKSFTFDSLTQKQKQQIFVSWWITSLSITSCFPFRSILGIFLSFCTGCFLFVLHLVLSFPVLYVLLSCVDVFSPACSLYLYVNIFIPSWLFIYLYIAEAFLQINGEV